MKVIDDPESGMVFQFPSECAIHFDKAIGSVAQWQSQLPTRIDFIALRPDPQSATRKAVLFIEAKTSNANVEKDPAARTAAEIVGKFATSLALFTALRTNRHASLGALLPDCLSASSLDGSRWILLLVVKKLQGEHCNQMRMWLQKRLREMHLLRAWGVHQDDVYVWNEEQARSKGYIA
jgi:hypothetical protein